MMEPPGRAGVSAPVGVAPRRAQVGTALVFFVHGVVIATWVPRIPAIKERLGLTEGSLGVALLGLAAGALLAMQVVGPLLGRFGSRPVTRVAVLANAALLVAPALAWNLPSLLLALWLFGSSIGLVDTAMNAHGVVVERSRGRPIMAGASSLWSGAGGAGLVGFCSFVGEGTAADWSALYLRQLGASAGAAAAGYAAFSLAMATCRLLGVGLAAVVPIAFSAAGNLGGHGGVGIARVASLAYLGTLAGPPAIGFTAELLGLRLALLIPLVLSLVVVLCAGGVATAAGP